MDAFHTNGACGTTRCTNTSRFAGFTLAATATSVISRSDRIHASRDPTGLRTIQHIVYLLVEYAHTHAIAPQAIGAGSVACVSYVLYRRYIFTAEVK